MVVSSTKIVLLCLITLASLVLTTIAQSNLAELNCTDIQHTLLPSVGLPSQTFRTPAGDLGSGVLDAPRPAASRRDHHGGPSAGTAPPRPGDDTVAPAMGADRVAPSPGADSVAPASGVDRVALATGADRGETAPVSGDGGGFTASAEGTPPSSPPADLTRTTLRASAEPPAHGAWSNAPHSPTEADELLTKALDSDNDQSGSGPESVGTLEKWYEEEYGELILEESADPAGTAATVPPRGASHPERRCYPARGTSLCRRATTRPTLPLLATRSSP